MSPENLKPQLLGCASETLIIANDNKFYNLTAVGQSIYMKFLIMGCGSIGERHLRNLMAVTSGSSIDIFDVQQERLMDVSKKYGANPVKESAIDSPYDCVLICTPPISHVPLTARALAAGSNVLVEKPLSSSLRGADKLLSLAKRKKLLAFVAYNFRFNQGINLVKKMLQEDRYGKVVHVSSYFGQYLPDWRPWQDYKKGYTANKSLGGGIIHDGSHEIDYLVWIFGRPTHIQSQFARTEILSADTEAIADILLKFRQALAYVHLDFVRREYRRSLEVLCENGIIYWSLAEDVVKTFDASTKKWDVIKLNENVNDMYVAEIKHVVECIQAKKKSEIISLENGLSTLSLSDAVNRSGRIGKRLSV